MLSNTCKTLYTCKSISIDTVSLRLSQSAKFNIDPVATNNTQKQIIRHHHQKMNHRITAHDPCARMALGAAHEDNRHEWHVNNIHVDCAMTRRRPDDYVPFQSMFQPDGRYAYNPNAPRYPQLGMWAGGTARDSSNMPSAAVYPRNTVVPLGIHYDRM
jgi:hypothetical protein